MHLDSSFMLAKLSLWKHLQTEVNRSRVKSIHVAIKLKDVVHSLLPSLLYHVEGKVLENSIVTIFVCLGKVAPCDMFANSKMVALLLMCLQSYNQVTQTCAIAKLPKHQGQELIPTGEMLHIAIAIVLLDDTEELEVIKKLNHLCENEFIFVHMLSIEFGSKITISNRCARISSATN